MKTCDTAWYMSGMNRDVEGEKGVVRTDGVGVLHKWTMRSQWFSRKFDIVQLHSHPSFVLTTLSFGLAKYEFLARHVRGGRWKSV